MSLNPLSAGSLNSYFGAIATSYKTGDVVLVRQDSMDKWCAVSGRAISPKELATTKVAELVLKESMATALSSSEEQKVFEILDVGVHVLLSGDYSLNDLRTLKHEDPDLYRKKLLENSDSLKVKIFKRIAEVEKQNEVYHNTVSRLSRIPQETKVDMLQELLESSTEMQVLTMDEVKAASAYYAPEGAFSKFLGSKPGKDHTIADVQALNETLLATGVTGSRDEYAGLSRKEVVFAELDLLADKVEGDVPVMILQPGNNDIRNGAQVYELIKTIQEWSQLRGRPTSIRLTILGYGGHPTTMVNESFIRVMNDEQKVLHLLQIIENEEPSKVAKIEECLMSKFEAKAASCGGETLEAYKAIRGLPLTGVDGILDTVSNDERLKPLLATLGTFLPISDDLSQNIYFMHGTPEAVAFKKYLQAFATDLDLKFVTEFADDTSHVQVAIEPYSLHTGMNVANAKRFLGIEKHSSVFVVSAGPSAKRQWKTFAWQLPKDGSSTGIAEDGKYEYFDRIIGYAATPSRANLESLTTEQLDCELVAGLAERAREIVYLVHSPFLVPQAMNPKDLNALAAFYLTIFPEHKTVKDVLETVAVSEIMRELGTRFGVLEKGIEFCGEAEGLVDRAKSIFRRRRVRRALQAGDSTMIKLSPKAISILERVLSSKKGRVSPTGSTSSSDDSGIEV